MKRLRISYVIVGIVLLSFAICVIYPRPESAFSEIDTDKETTVIIDAGHGGEDGGAVSASGMIESSINLAVAKKAEQFLAFCGIKTHMTRSDENAVHTQGNTIRERKISDLKNRVSAINAFKKAVLISIHQNHFPDSKYTGTQVFYADTDGSQILASGMQNLVQSSLNQPKQRKAKKAESTYLMKNIQCTGVLIECGFLSNPQEALNLQDEDYQKKLICVIGCSIARYLEQGSEYIEV